MCCSFGAKLPPKSFDLMSKAHHRHHTVSFVGKNNETSCHAAWHGLHSHTASEILNVYSFKD